MSKLVEKNRYTIDVYRFEDPERTTVHIYIGNSVRPSYKYSNEFAKRFLERFYVAIRNSL